MFDDAVLAHNVGLSCSGYDSKSCISASRAAATMLLQLVKQ